MYAYNVAVVFIDVFLYYFFIFPCFLPLYIYAHIDDNRFLTRRLKSNIYILDLLMFYTIAIDHDVLPFLTAVYSDAVYCIIHGGT